MRDNGFKKKGKSQSNVRSKSRNKCTKYQACQKEGPYRCDCPIIEKGLENGSDCESDVVIELDDGLGVLAISTYKTNRDWIVDSMCSFHIYLIKK